MRIAIAQISSTTDPVENLTQVESQAAKAAQQGARLVVFPEATMCRFGVPLDQVAEPIDGPWADKVRAIARAHGLTIVAGMFTPADAGRVHNTMLVTGPNVETTYNKIHLYDAFGFAESDTVAPGNDVVTFEVDETTVGIATCYDIRFPALFQELAARGAELITLSASWGAGPGKADQWNLLAQARALDSGTFVAACDQAAPSATSPETGTAPLGVGSSLVVGPLGQVLDRLGDGPDLLVVDVPTEEVRRAQAATGVLVNRRILPDFAPLLSAGAR